jgi:serine/threonine protein kinase
MSTPRSKQQRFIPPKNERPNDFEINHRALEGKPKFPQSLKREIARPMGIVIKEKLGEGVAGTVYKSIVEGKSCIYKLERYLKEKGSADPYWRQVEFDEDFRKTPGLLKLVAHGVLIDCAHKQPIPPWYPEKHRWRLELKNVQSNCYFLAYEPVLEGTLNQVKDRLTLDDIKQLALQLLKTINALKKKKWHHRDLHDKNIMFRKNKHGSFRWYVIDYGLAVRADFEESYDDRIMQQEFDGDIWGIIWALIRNPELKDELNELPPYDLFLERMRALEIYPQIKTRPADNNRETVALILHSYEMYLKCMGLSFRYSGEPVQAADIIKLCVQHADDEDFDVLIHEIEALVPK